MPLRSRSQQRWMFANHPKMAKRWAEETPDMSRLPEKSKRRNESRVVTIPRSRLQEIVFEEVLGALREAGEDPEETEEDDPGKKTGKSPEVKDAASAPPKGKEGSPDARSPKSLPKGAAGQPASQKPPKKGPPPGDEPVPDAPDPADDDISPEGDDEGGGELNDELAGKTVQSLSMEPKSKLVAGAQEIVLTFNETTDPLRIIVTKTGAVRFFYRGALHNMP